MKKLNIYSDGLDCGANHPAYEKIVKVRESADSKQTRKWQLIIQEYTQTRLSFPTDRPIAIAGVAQIFSISGREGYLAGLWQDSICSDLLWSIKQGSHILPRLPENRAPSWSWILWRDRMDVPSECTIVRTAG
jgi:hypothetical protein